MVVTFALGKMWAEHDSILYNYMLTLKINNKNFIHSLRRDSLFFQYFDSTSIINYQNNYYLAVHVRVNALTLLTNL